MDERAKVLDLMRELNTIRDEVERKKLDSLISSQRDIGRRIMDGTITEEEYDDAINTFDMELSCDKQLNGLSNFAMLLMMLINKSDDDSKMHSVRKPKGAYSVPDKVIDGVISNIIHGERVSDACSYAGISTVTLYNRIKDRGYKDIKKFFKDMKRSLKEEN